MGKLLREKHKKRRLNKKLRLHNNIKENNSTISQSFERKPIFRCHEKPDI